MAQRDQHALEAVRRAAASPTATAESPAVRRFETAADRWPGMPRRARVPRRIRDGGPFRGRQRAGDGAIDVGQAPARVADPAVRRRVAAPRARTPPAPSRRSAWTGAARSRSASCDCMAAFNPALNTATRAWPASEGEAASQQIESGFSRHHQVGHEQRGRALAQRCHRFADAGTGDELDRQVFERQLDKAPDRRIVVDQHHARPAHAVAANVSASRFGSSATRELACGSQARPPRRRHRARAGSHRER